MTDKRMSVWKERNRTPAPSDSKWTVNMIFCLCLDGSLSLPACILRNVIRSTTVTENLDPWEEATFSPCPLPLYFLLFLSFSDGLNGNRLLELSYQMQIQNFGHFSFTFKRNSVITFITGSSKSEIRKKAPWQWLMPKAFSWFAD